MSRRDPKWQRPTRQEQGRATEKRLVSQRGGKVHPMSGAGRIKLDGSTAEESFEVKDANKSFTLKASELKTAFQQAAQEGKEAVWLITYLALPGYVVEVRVVPDEGRRG